MAAALVPSDINVSVALDEPSPSGAPTSDFKFSLNAGQKKTKQTGRKEKEADGEDRQGAKDSEYISELVANVTRVREQYESAGVPEKLLKEKLEAIVLAQKKGADKSTEQDADATCPPPGFTSIYPFSLKDYISGAFDNGMLACVDRVRWSRLTCCVFACSPLVHSGANGAQ